MSSNKKILKLEDNKEYFVLDQILDNDDTYLLVLNVDNEYDIKICKKIIINEEDFILDVDNESLLSDLKSRFKELVSEEEKQFI